MNLKNVALALTLAVAATACAGSAAPRMPAAAGASTGNSGLAAVTQRSDAGDDSRARTTRRIERLSATERPRAVAGDRAERAGGAVAHRL
jgi:hypothetical protein